MVLVAGGHDHDKNALRSAHLYNLNSDTWEALPDMTHQRDECAAVAAAFGRGPRPAVLEDTRTLLTQAGSGFTASMLRDIEAGHRVEADHILGDLIARGNKAGVFTSLLEVAYCHVKAYEGRHRKA